MRHIKSFNIPKQTPETLVADAGPDIPGGEGANKGFWRQQWRDRLKRFAKMGRSIRFTLEINGVLKSFIGRFKGASKDNPNLARVLVKGDPDLPDGYYYVDSNNGEMIVATLSDSRLRKLGIGRDEKNRFVPLDQAKSAQRLEDVIFEPLEGTEPEKPRALKKKMTGAEVQARKMSTVYENLKEEGRFPVPRQTTSNHWGKNSDIAEGAKEDYNLVYEQLKGLDPKWEQQYPNFEDFWNRVQELSVGQTSQSPNDLADIPEEMKEINRAYAERVLGLEPDGKITYYRNAVNQKGTPEESALGYVTTNADFAYDYNSQAPNINGNGRYEIDVQPDEVFGMLGYSQLEDEFGVVIGRGVTSQPGRVRRVGDLEQPKMAPWLEKYQGGVGRSTGGTPYRHYALAGQFDFLPVDPLGTDVNDFLQKHGKTSADIKAKFDELYGEGAYDAYKASDNTLTFSAINNLFVDAGDGKVGLDITKIEGGEGGFLAPSGYGDTANPESFENDRVDNTLKMLSVFQELSGQPFMVHRNNPKAEKLVEEQGGYEGMASALADPFRRDPIPEKTYASILSPEAPKPMRSLFSTEEADTAAYALAALSDPDKAQRFGKLLDELERPTIDKVDLPDGWSALDPREVFARQHGTTIDELREFLALDPDSPEIDNPLYNDAKKFLYKTYRPYVESLKSDKLSVKSLRSDVYMHPDGTTVTREYAHSRPDPSEPFDDGFAVGGRESVTMAAERYDILRERAPLNEPLNIVLSSSQHNSMFQAILNDEHGEGAYRDATAFATGTNTIVMNMNDSLLHSKRADKEAVDFLKQLLKDGKEVQFPFSYEDLEAMEDPSYFGYVLTHEYGHLFDHNHLHIHREESGQAAQGETSERYNALFDSHEHDPSEYGATNVSEFFAEHFAYYLMTGKAKHPDIQRDIEERTGITVLPQDKTPIEAKALPTPEPVEVPTIEGLYDNEPAGPSFSIVATTFDSDHTFTDKEYNVLSWFTDTGYDYVSQYLREGKDIPANYKVGTEILLNLIDQSDVTSEGIIYRGRPMLDDEQDKWQEILQYKVGDTFVDKGVGSHSSDGERARFYYEMNLGGTPIGRVFYRLSLKKGDKAFIIPDDAASYGASEKEVILPPNTHYKITGIYDIDGNRVLDVEIVEQEQLKPIEEYSSALPDLVPKPFPMQKPAAPKPVQTPKKPAPDITKLAPVYDTFNYDEPDLVSGNGTIIVPDSEAARALSKIGRDATREEIDKLQQKTRSIFSNDPDKYVPFEPKGTLTPEQQAMIDSLTPEGQAAFAYVDSSLVINKGLRDGDPTVEYGDQVQNLDKAMLVSEYLEPGMTVYRMVKLSRWEKFLKEGLVPGGILVDDAFLSTSHTKAFSDEAREIDEMTGDINQIPMRIVMPNNTAGLDLSSISWYDTEDEYLLPRGVALRFLGWDSNGYAVFERLT